MYNDDFYKTIESLVLSKQQLSDFLSVAKQKKYLTKEFEDFYNGILVIFDELIYDYSDPFLTKEEIQGANALLYYCLNKITKTNNFFKETDFFVKNTDIKKELLTIYSKNIILEIN